MQVLVVLAYIFATGSALSLDLQEPLVSTQSHPRRLTGRFLHLTDIHPDPFYKVYSGTDRESACHRHNGPAGLYGAETSDCDSPWALVNATFQWINDNLKDSIDFVVWTGDSARHDNDEKLPRSEQQVLASNRLLVTKFAEVFGKKDDRTNTDFAIPIVPTFGNNDILPHNIFVKGPNRWTKTYSQVWRSFIPEEQRHQFDRGGWFYVEVIPNRLAVFSLNTMYFFNSNAAVDGCALRHEPGYEQMDWLRIQLEFLRQRGMKAILTGHVPPARSSDKTSWDETCWQKYALWMRQYRDVVVGSLYGHMNIDHFVLQDFHDIRFDVLNGEAQPEARSPLEDEDGEISTASEVDYLVSLRKMWSKLPSAPSKDSGGGGGGHSGSQKQRFEEQIGGPWAERYAVSHIAPSIVPNYYPTLRVFEYNTTGLDLFNIPTQQPAEAQEANDHFIADANNPTDQPTLLSRLQSLTTTSKKKKKKPKFTTPDPPSKSSPPGPAYSPQPLSLLGYTQYFANLTYIQDDFEPGALRWRHGKHHGKKPKHDDPAPRRFAYEVEYDTRARGDVYGFGNGTSVRGWVELAARIGRFKKGARAGDVDGSLSVHDEEMVEVEEVDEADEGADVVEATGRKGGKGGKKKKKKKKKHHIRNASWYAFVERATVGALPEAELRDRFGQE